MTINSTSSGSNAAQEALETAAQTRAEAAKGDQQAAHKLAQTASAKISGGSAPADSDGDHDGSKLNVKA